MTLKLYDTFLTMPNQRPSISDLVDKFVVEAGQTKRALVGYIFDFENDPVTVETSVSATDVTYI